MKAAIRKLERDVAKLQRQYDTLIAKFYKTAYPLISDRSVAGDDDLYDRAEVISEQKFHLIDALNILKKYYS